jgi:hypothetical protein
MAARDCQISMPDSPWWQVFVGKDCSLALSTIVNALIGLAKQDDTLEIASKAFLKSLGRESFNDPDSYLWDQSN